MGTSAPQVKAASMRYAIAATAAGIVACLGLPCEPVQAVPVAERELDWVFKRTPDPAKGAKLYETCTACHGAFGEGVEDGTVPAIGGQHFTVLAKQLVDFRRGWRPDPRMRHFSDVRFLVYSQDIADVATHISGLPGRMPKPAPARDDSGRGALLHARTCARCHGDQGEGNPDELTPRLASQNAAYMARQFEDTAAGWRKPMAAAHGALAKMSAADTAAVLAFVSELRTRPTNGGG
jgi:cytochrome c553